MLPAYKMKGNAVRALLFLPYHCHQAHLLFLYKYLIRTVSSRYLIAQDISCMEQERILQTWIDREHVNRTRTRPSIWTTREGTAISSAEAACANDRIGAAIPNSTTKH
jgi:hypothetical protein